MRIRSQDKLRIIDAVDISISNDLGKKKFYVSAIAQGAVVNCTLATYTSKDDAIAELDKICDFFTQNPNGVYQFK